MKTSPSHRCCCRAGLLRHFHAVYAYCRWADDLADEAGGANRPRPSRLVARPTPCLLRQPAHSSRSDRASTDHSALQIPPEPFLDLLTAFEQDQHVKRYQTFDQLLDYCRCSANPVGRLVLYLGEVFDEKRAALSDSICTALQLANFWQYEPDFDIGRVYLPEEDRQRFGYSDDDLEARCFTPAFAQLMRFEVDRTRCCSCAGTLDRMDAAGLEHRRGFVCSRRIGRPAQDRTRRLQRLARRPVVSKWNKISLLAGAMLKRLGSAVSLR